MALKRRLLLLLLATALSCQGTREEPAASPSSSPGSDSEPRRKLCGRDFVRAVLFTCGTGWKGRQQQQEPQHATQQPLRGSARAEFVQSSSANGLKNIDPQSLFKLEQLRIDSQPVSQQLLKNLYKLYDDNDNYVPISDEFNSYPSQIARDVQKRDETRLVASVESYNFPGIKNPRRKRDNSIGISAICCSLGCTQKEIRVLC